MDTNTRLRIATRIHFALLRHLGDSVEVQDILHRTTEMREVLWVCEASGDEELIALASQFRRASRSDTPAPVDEMSTVPDRSGSGPRSQAPADSSWGKDSSGFGVSRPPELRTEKPASGKSERKPEHTPERKARAKTDRDWLKPRTWLRTR